MTSFSTLRASTFTSLLLLCVVCGRRLDAADVLLEKPREHGGFFSFAISPRGRLAAGGTGIVEATFGNQRSVAGGEVLLWDARSGKLAKTLGKHGDSVTWVAFSADEKALVSASEKNGVVQVWSLPRGRLRKRFKVPAPIPKMTRPVLSQDAKLMVSVQETKIRNTELTRSGTLTALDPLRGRKLWSVKDSHAETTAISPDGRTVAAFIRRIEWRAKSGGEATGRTLERALVFWNAKDGKEIRRISRKNLYLSRIAFLPDGKRIAGADGKRLLIWDVDDPGEPEEIGIGGKRSPDQIVFSKEGRIAAIPRFMGERIDFLDLETKKMLPGIDAEFPNTIDNPAFSRDLSRMACRRGFDPVIVDLSGLRKR